MDAAAWKAKGNEHFSAKNFDEAIEAFSKAIELDGSNHVLYSNRSASFASLNKYAEAKADAEKCVALNGSWAKGYVRLGAALHGAGDLDAAKQAYEQGLKVEPENASLKSGLESLEQDMNAGGGANDTFSKLFGPDCLAKARANPKLAPYCAQPDYVQKMNMIAQNPTMAQAMMQDQRIMHTMLEFSGIDMNALGKQDAPAQPQPTQQSAPAPAKPAPSKPAAAPKPELTPAQKVKEEGNALYKQRKFDEALAKYKEAADLEPTNTTFLLNQTAVHFEMGNYELCFDEVEKALEHAREHKADYTAVAKLMTRKASCLQKMKKYDEAVELFQKALLEHRNAETLTKLDACKAERKKAEAEAYFDEEKGKIAKDEGNVHFKENRYPEAVKCYDEAEKRNPNDHTIYSNRAAALLRLMAYEDVIRDCDKCLAIKPDFVKAVTRKAHAYFWTKQYTKAMSQYDEAIKIDPTFQEAVEGKHKTMMKIQENASGEGDEEAAQRAMQDPEIQGILQDSYMQMVLSEMQKDPKKISDYMRDPGISAKLNKLIMAGVLRVGNQPAGAGAKGRR